MSSLTLHVLDARGQLAGHVAWMRDALTRTHAQAAALLPLGPLDVVVMAGRRVVAEKGHVGYAPSPGVIFVTVDPDSAPFQANEAASLERMFAHELHHAARWDGPGYGRTLGEALVSEGLAGHFARELCGDLPEPWETLPNATLAPHLPQAEAAWDQAGYDHAEWFFGAGALPNYLGYSLGVQIIGRYLAQNPQARPSGLSAAPASSFRACLDLGMGPA